MKSFRYFLDKNGGTNKLFMPYYSYYYRQTLTHDQKRPKYKGPFSMDYRERGSHARGVYPTQYTSRMGTARTKQEEEADTRIIVKE